MAFSLLSLLFGGVSTLAANSPDSFQVEVSPSSADVNQFLDITITAIKKWTSYEKIMMENFG